MSDSEDTDVSNPVHGGEAGGAEVANDTVANPVAQTDDGEEDDYHEVIREASLEDARELCLEAGLGAIPLSAV